MTDVTVKFLAMEIKIPVERLIQQFADAGLNKTAVDFVTSQEKEILLVHLNKGRKIILNELTLQRKTRSTLNVPSIGGKSKQVQVEVRKKRIYVASEPQIYHHQVMSDDKVINNIVENKEINAVVHNDEIIHQNDVSCSSNSTHFIDKCDQDVTVAKIKHEVQKVDYHKAKVKAKIQGVVNVLGDVVKNKRNDRHHRFDSLFDVHKNNDRDYQSPILHVRCKGDNKNHLKGENDRRSRTRVRSKSRGLKVIKFRKHYNYDVVSDAKNEREESRSFNRSIKIKQLKLNNNNLMQAFNKPTKFVTRDVVIGETITVADLANRMAVKSSYLIKTMMNLGIMATLNQILDQDTAQLVVEEMGHKVILYRDNALEELVLNDRNVNVINNATKVRAPVVTIMGHVDHGKTSLLDYIRSSRVAITEVGGITQHIGAYHVETSNGMITFLDTPGHAAFTAMRARGTKVTDIVVLVIAADDGVMLQTIEAIKHAKAAQVPIIVAINKIDKSEANPDRIKNELVKYGVIPEEWGGDNQFIHVSAKLGTGVNDLLEAIILQAEILELKTVYDGMASGVVIEAYLDKSRGPVATVLVREGTLKRGDVVLCGFEYGRIRYMRDEMGRNITFAGPSIPVEIFGLSGSPIAGDILTVVRDEKKAREVAFYRQGKFRDIKLSCQKESKLKNVFSNMIHASHDVISELNIVLKSDFQGSSEAIVESLQSLSTDKVKIKIVYSSIGSITETDVSLAMASNAILLGFNVRADASARRIINIEKIDIRYYCVIYDLINEVKQYLDDLFVPRYKQEIIGVAEVRSVFRSPKYGFIAGCMVIEGIMKRHNQMRILRDNVSIYEGELDSLRRFKDDVNEVRHGMECGIGIKNYVDICSGDRIEVLNKVVSD